MIVTLVSSVLIVTSVWSCAYSKCSETNVHIKERMNCSEYSGCIKKSLMDTAACLFSDIRFSDSHRPYFFIKNGLALLKEKALEILSKYGRTESLRQLAE